jgi:chitin-binding protein
MALAAVAALAITTGFVVLNTGPAHAHGAMMAPGSRTYLCWRDGLTASGQIVPRNPACAAAVAHSGTTSLYNWFAVLRSDGAGRTSGFIPDGQACSGGTGGPYDFTGFNFARDDWPVTHLTSGATMRFDYNNWAKHPGTFYLYVTKDSWSPTRPLAWNDLEPAPFSQVTNPESIGGPGTNDGRYTWTGRLPANKSGRHLIYSVWSRSDSTETFYGCSDVVFDGGNGEVTGVGPGGSTPDPDPTETPTPTGDCSATFRAIDNNWPGHFQGEVTVRNTGTGTLNGWTVGWNYTGGQGFAGSPWNATLTGQPPSVVAKNVAHNGQLAPNASTTFGFNATGTAPSPVPALTCTSP